MVGLAAILWLTCFVLSAILIPIYLYKVSSVLALLRRSHHDEWQSLGCPTLFLNNSLQNSGRVVKWLVLSDYVLLDDKELERRGDQTRGLLLVCGSILFFQLCLTPIVFLMEP